MRARIGIFSLSAFVSLLLLYTFSSAQQQSSQPSYSVRVKVVNVPATVRDKHGLIVRNLKKDDFVLEEDGRPQEIHYFSQESDLPLTLGLLVDTSLSQRRVLDDERRASNSFLDRILREDRDKAFVIHFDREVELLQDLTPSKQKLQEALNDLHMPDMRDRNDPASSGGGGQTGGGYPGGSNGPWGGGYPGGGRWPGGGGGYPGGGHRGGHRGGYGGPGTVLYDAVFLGSDELMRKQQGRKAVIILSDGVDTGSKLSLERAVEAAQRSDTIVYSILFSDEQIYSGGGFGGFGRHGGLVGSPADGKKVLDRISKETGGRMFEVSKKQPIEKIYAQIEEELRSQYSLGYTPDRPDIAPGYHKITVKAKPKDLTVQARAGYYFEPNAQRAQK